MAVLLDQYGNPIKLDKSVLTREIAAPTTTGVRRHEPSGISTGLTPAALAGLLRASESHDPRAYFRLAEEMEEKELQYLTVLGSRKRAVCQLEITVEPAGDSADDEANAALVREFLSRDELEDELFDLLDAIGKGIAITEIVWETSERQWMPACLEWVHPTFIEFDPRDLRTPMLKTADGPQPLPAYKFIDFRLRAKSGIPIRGGLARPVAWAYLFKNFDIKGWVQFMEVYGQPLRLGKYGAGATDEEKRILLRAVREIGADAAAVIPSGMEIEFITDRGSRGGDGHKALAEYMDHQISKVVLGQSTTTDAISGGHAVSREHNEVREDIERADAKALAACLNRQLIRPLIDLNRGPQKAYPRIRIGRPESVDLDQLTRGVERMAKYITFSATEIRSKMGLKAPESPDDAFGGGPPAQPASVPGADRSAQQRALARAEAPRTVIEDHFVGDILDEEWEQLMEPLIAPIRDMIEQASSYEEVRGALIDTLERMDDGAVRELLARAGFVTRIAAAVGAIDDDDLSEG